MKTSVQPDASDINRRTSEKTGTVVQQGMFEKGPLFGQLIQRLNSGDNTALDEIWALFGDFIRRRARNRLRAYGIAGKTESMDICNAVLLDILKQEELQIRNPGDFLGYFCRAVDNQVRTVVRSLLAEKRDFRRDVSIQAAAPLESESSGPTFKLIRQEIFEMLAQQLGHQGPAIVETVLANGTWVDVGRLLNCSADSARMKWNRALSRIRDQLSPRGGHS